MSRERKGQAWARKERAEDAMINRTHRSLERQGWYNRHREESFPEGKAKVVRQKAERTVTGMPVRRKLKETITPVVPKPQPKRSKIVIEDFTEEEMVRLFKMKGIG